MKRNSGKKGLLGDKARARMNAFNKYKRLLVCDDIDSVKKRYELYYKMDRSSQILYGDQDREDKSLLMNITNPGPKMP